VKSVCLSEGSLVARTRVLAWLLGVNEADRRVA
jgi:hypothetical protein